MLNGIDVSSYQGGIDWNKVHNAGYVFAAMKATEGISYWDGTFIYNWKHSREAGVRRIAYHFLRPSYSGYVQAAVFHDYVHDCGGFHPGDCCMLDIEATDGESINGIISSAEVFVEHMLRNTGIGIYIYTGSYFWNETLAGAKSAILAKCPLWLASYGSQPQPIANWPGGYSIWQWTDSLSIDGISAQCDGNRFLGTLQQYDKLALLGGRA